MERNAQKELLQGLLQLVGPLGDVASSPGALQQVFGVVGWNLDASTIGNVSSHLQTMFTTVVPSVRQWLTNPPQALSEFRAALSDTRAMMQELQQLKHLLNVFDEAEQGAETVVTIITDFLALLALQGTVPAVYRGLSLLTIIQPGHFSTIFPSFIDSQGKLLRFKHDRADLRWELIWDTIKEFSNLTDAMKAEFLITEGNETEVNAHRLLPHLSGLLQSLGFQVAYSVKPAYGCDFGPGGEDLAFRMLSFWRDSDDGLNRFGATLALPTAEQRPAALTEGPVLAVMPFGNVTLNHAFDDWDVALSIDANCESLWLSPDGVRFGDSSGNFSTGGLTVQVAANRRPTEEGLAFLLGSTTGTRLVVEGFRIVGEMRFEAESSDDIGVGFEVDGASVIVSPGDGDGFLQAILPDGGLRVDFDLTLGWSQKRGLYFGGGAGLQTQVPLGASNPPSGALPAPREQGGIGIDSLHLAIEPKLEDVAASVSITGALQLGPVTAVVDRMGLEAVARLTEDGSGNLGLIDVSLDFRLPNSVGLAIDTGPLVGGGYLEIDKANHRYVGVLQLEFSGIELQAVGLLSTRMPDGSSGYSLLILITAEFEPIQLGFGFTLNGVGGLIGLNRTANIEALRAGIRDNTMNSILFPDDPIRDAPQIISDLRRVFPPTSDRHVFGPMALIGWGNPTVLTAKVGLILELPEPIRLLILGQVRCLLPAEENPLVRINVDILGVLDFERGEFSLDARVYDSKLGAYDLNGDIALRSRWKANPTFALSVGGFHPRFQPPPGFPTLRRMTVDLGSGNNPRLALEGYLAVTSNSIQFGALAELRAAAGSFSVHGYVGFDVLFILSRAHLRKGGHLEKA